MYKYTNTCKYVCKCIYVKLQNVLLGVLPKACLCGTVHVVSTFLSLFSPKKDCFLLPPAGVCRNLALFPQFHGIYEGESPVTLLFKG